MNEEAFENPDVSAAVSPSSDPTLGGHEEAVLVYDAADREDALVAQTALKAAGIPAFLKSPATSPYFGALGDPVDNVFLNGVYVAPSQVEAARAILNASISEEELIAAEEADTMTLEEAEWRVRKM